MKLIAFIFISLSATFAFFFNNNLAVEMPVGSIIYSIIEPKSFLINNPDWRFMDGQTLDKSSQLFEMTALSIIPDTRGLFIRSSNYLGLGEDPDLNRTIGSRQKWLTGRPESTFKFQGSKHSLFEVQENETPYFFLKGKVQVDRITGKFINYLESEKDLDLKKFGIRRNNKVYDLSATGFALHSSPSDNLSTRSDVGGDIETRPSNVSFYAYIKVN